MLEAAASLLIPNSCNRSVKRELARYATQDDKTTINQQNKLPWPQENEPILLTFFTLGDGQAVALRTE